MEKQSVIGKEEPIFEFDVALWALPYEGIPLHIKFKEDFQFDNIIVQLPENISLVDTINIGDYEINHDEITIRTIKRTSRSCSNYFGLVVKYEKIPESLKIEEKIKFNIIKGSLIISTFNVPCRIFRPELKLLTVPKQIVLMDNAILNDVPLELQYVGFGDIQIEIEARIGGNLVSQGESLIYEVLLRLSEKKLFDSEEIKSGGEASTLIVDPAFVNDVADKVQVLVRDGNIPQDILDEETISGLREYFTDLKKRDNFSEIIFGEINTLLLSILKDILERNPEDNIELKDARTRVKAEINAPIENIQLKINYFDLLKNKYEPLEVTIAVDDKLRTHKNTKIDMFIKIEKIDNRPFYNVKEIDMEE